MTDANISKLMNSDLQWIHTPGCNFEFFFRSILSKLLHSEGQKAADYSWVLGEVGERE